MSSEQKRKTPDGIAKSAANAITHSLTSRKIVRSSDSHTQFEQPRALESLPAIRKIQKVQNEPNPKNGHSAGAFSTRDKRQSTSRLPTPHPQQPTTCFSLAVDPSRKRVLG
jgi:hypothetical protein